MLSVLLFPLQQFSSFLENSSISSSVAPNCSAQKLTTYTAHSPYTDLIVSGLSLLFTSVTQSSVHCYTIIRTVRILLIHLACCLSLWSPVYTACSVSSSSSAPPPLFLDPLKPQHPVSPSSRQQELASLGRSGKISERR